MPIAPLGPYQSYVPLFKQINKTESFGHINPVEGTNVMFGCGYELTVAEANPIIIVEQPNELVIVSAELTIYDPGDVTNSESFFEKTGLQEKSFPPEATKTTVSPGHNKAGPDMLIDRLPPGGFGFTVTLKVFEAKMLSLPQGPVR